MTHSIQDRTPEFRSILATAQRRQNSSKAGAQRQSLLSESQKKAANGSPGGERARRSEFAQNAARIGRGIGGTMAKLEKLAQLASRKTLFDDSPAEINQLTAIIKQDLAALTHQLASLQELSRAQHGVRARPGDQEAEHNGNVINQLQKSIRHVGDDFKEVLETRTKNVAAIKERTSAFVNSAASHAQRSSLDVSRTESPLYQSPQRGRSPKPGYTTTNAAQQDLLSLDPNPPGGSALMRAGPQSDAQLLMMEEAQTTNSYIQERGLAIDTIERTLNELGGVFGQLAQMVSEQGEMITRIDENTQDTVENVEGAQRELMKYWSRVSGNRWLVAKMFGVLMIFFLLWVLIAG